MAVARRAREAEDDHVGPITPNGPDYVGENAIAAPFFQCLGRGLTETEVDRAGEELLRPVNLAGVQEFLGTDDTQFSALFRADEVLSALSAGHRKIRRPHMPAAREI